MVNQAGAANLAGVIADFYNSLIEKKIPSAIAVQLSIGWMNAMLGAAAQQNKDKSADVIVDWLSKTKGGVGN